ncbi:hypothetical protein DLAC_05338 [Tieghemostelium lacteum]|uniref:Uncharacterized protein n=1 Tax=Tieghemostelium lacteum TaxID=361077 RepID=A0A151ZHT9_TIELA|nr:hypothetical protein DLAC_05338 [Tieghemostelium lacteum]|eukprot:KYQ93552.1 hypothetical protein DLAC_05338 [Tieghemostelium lacteum]
MQACPYHKGMGGGVDWPEDLANPDWITPINETCNQACKDFAIKQYDRLIEFARMCQLFYRHHDFKGTPRSNVGVLVFMSYLEGKTYPDQNEWIEEYFSCYKKK